MELAALVVIVVGSLTLTAVAWLFLQKFKTTSLQNILERDKRERELKRRVLELQVLRSLGERVGYSLDLRQILEVIIDSLTGLVEFSTVAYALPSKDGQIIFKIHLETPISHSFVNQVKVAMLSSLSVMRNENLPSSFIQEIVSGAAISDQVEEPIHSFFNLPIILAGRPVALINVASTKEGLYGDEETAILYTILGQVSSQATKLAQVIENEKRRLSAMISSLTDGVMMVDPKLNIIVTNPALTKLLKVAGKMTIFEVVAAVGTKADLKEAIDQSLNQQTLIRIPEFELLGQAVAIDVEPVKDKFGYLLGVAVVFHDVTAQRNLERLREEFTAMMVHELRSPLTTITYSADMVISDFNKFSAEQVIKSLGVVKNTAAEMLNLVNELLDVAKIEAGKFEVVKKDNDLRGLIGEKLTLFQPLVEHKKLQLQAEIDPVLPPFAFDRKRLGQVLDNLLSNAIKYTEDGSVSILAKLADNRVVISVADTGEGIAASDIPKLFSKFEQLGKGKTGDRGGTGLGLVVTKGIIEAHGGQIGVESAGLGKGTTFTFFLPLG